MTERRKIFKIIIIGNIGSNLVGKFRDNYLGASDKDPPDVGAEFSIKRIKMNGEEVVLQFWLLQQGTRFTTVREVYHHASAALLLLFDTSRWHSFESLPNWIAENLVSNKNRALPMILIGLTANSTVTREVDYEDMDDYTSQLSTWSGIEVPWLDINLSNGQIRANRVFNSVDDYLKELVRKIQENL